MIVDASVVFKWLRAESDSTLARRLLERSDLVAPSVLRVELGYALTKLVRQRSLSLAQAGEAWRALDLLPLTWLSDGPHQTAAFELSLRLSVSFYDCLYLALALSGGDILVTADERFVHAVRTAPDLRGHIVSLAETAA